MPIDDPYAPPASDLAPTTLPVMSLRGQLLLLVAFGLNLIVPTLIASTILAPLGRVGSGWVVRP